VAGLVHADRGPFTAPASLIENIDPDDPFFSLYCALRPPKMGSHPVGFGRIIETCQNRKDLFPGDQKMKLVDIACTSWMVALLTVSSQTSADTSMETAMANCREEAVSTGLVEDADITAYIDLCMQAWQNPADYTEWEPADNDKDEMQAETPEYSSP
jgi:hypothetical protein